MKKRNTRLFMRIVCCTVAFHVLTHAGAFAQALSYYQCAEVDGNDPANYKLQVRMLGLHAAIKADNRTGSGARTYTVTIKNVDPDFVMLSEGATTAKGANSLTFTWTVAAGSTQWVWINPWYLTPTNFYFIA